MVVVGVLLLSVDDFEGDPHGDAALHHVHDVGVDALFEAFPAALFHVAPSGFGYGHGAGEGHVGDAVDVAYCLGPQCCHYSLDVGLLVVGKAVAGVEPVALLEGCHGHAPVIELGQVAGVLGVVKVGVFAGCHYELVAVVACELDALGGEGVAPGDEGDVGWVGEEVVVGRGPDVVELAPESGLLAVTAHDVEYLAEEWYH